MGSGRKAKKDRVIRRRKLVAVRKAEQDRRRAGKLTRAQAERVIRTATDVGDLAKLAGHANRHVGRAVKRQRKMLAEAEATHMKAYFEAHRPLPAGALDVALERTAELLGAVATTSTPLEVAPSSADQETLPPTAIDTDKIPYG